MTATPAIETVGLTKHFGNVIAVEDVSLRIEPGEVFGFLGPNGAGKSTTIRCLLDLIRPTSGTCAVAGLDSRRDAVEIRRHLGFLPADLALYPTLTGRDTLRFLANLRGGVDWTWVDVLADRFDADLDKRVGELSSGNRQKVGLIQAFMNRPEVVILDEPITGLDPLVQLELHTLLREHAARGNAVFLSSHALAEVERVADRVGFIRRGRLIAVERMSELMDKALHRVRLDFATPVPAEAFRGLPGVLHAVADGATVTVQYEGPMTELLRVAAAHDVVSLSSAAVDLDEIFLAFYRDRVEDGPPGAEGGTPSPASVASSPRTGP